MFRSLIKTAQVRRINLHGLRHTHASLALQRGVPVEVLSKRLGHARVDITLNLYRHVYDIEMKEAALTFDDLMGRARALQIVGYLYSVALERIDDSYLNCAWSTVRVQLKAGTYFLRMQGSMSYYGGYYDKGLSLQ